MIRMTITDKKKNGDKNVWRLNIKTDYYKANHIISLFLNILAINGFNFEMKNLEVKK